MSSGLRSERGPEDEATLRAVERYAREPSTFARRFFLLTLLVFGSALGVTRLAVWLGGERPLPNWGHFPPAFVPSSILLLIGSSLLHVAMAAVRQEQTQRFRTTLTAALIAGTLFVGLQIYGLWSMLTARPLDDASTGVTVFVFLLAALHGMHFTIAQMFLTYVTIKAYARRYDHEYYWGVRVCAWFWHGLGMLWIAILVAFLVTSPGVHVPAGETLRIWS